MMLWRHRMYRLYHHLRDYVPSSLRRAGKRIGVQRLIRGLPQPSELEAHPELAWPLGGLRRGIRLRLGDPGNSFLLAQPYEPDVSRFLASTVQPGWTCADIGAHIGLHTLLLARLVGPKGRVVAFEAFPGNAQVLQDNVSLNDLQSRATVENMAVLDGKHTQVLLFQGRQNSMSFEWNTVGHTIDGTTAEAALSIRAVALDDYFPSGSQLDFVKMDIEGAEAQALVGMRRLLREARPIVVIEFHGQLGWSSRTELYAARYDLFTMDGCVLDPTLDTQYVYQCFAIPSELNNHGAL